MKKYIIALVLIIIVAGGVFFYWQQNKSSLLTDTEPVQVACTEEAKICPDGSAVGRQGPNCEFAECPISVVPAEPVAQVVDEMVDWKTYRNEEFGFEFKYPKDYSLDFDCSGGDCLFLRVLPKSAVPGTHGVSPVLIISYTKSVYPYGGDIVKFVASRYNSNVILNEGIKDLKIESIDLGKISGAKVTASKVDEMGVRSETQTIYAVDPKATSNYFTFGFWQFKASDEELSNFVNVLSSVEFFKISKSILSENGYQLTLPNNFENLLLGYKTSFSSSGPLKIEVVNALDSHVSNEYGKCTSYSESVHGPDEYSYNFIDLGNRMFCRSRFGEAGMGKTYGNYKYMTKIADNFVIISFALQTNTQNFSEENWNKSLALVEQAIATLVSSNL
ncbi:MAG TPA: hypothetical protein P5274_01000 [Candidatus Paceibacterota bacterium]|nr:hypothetical protein [Candidatus Paceibacterota bacterium]